MHVTDTPLACTFWLSLALGFVSTSFIACTRETIVSLVPVRGQVLVEDQPVTFGTVSFRPDAKRGNTSMEQPHGTIDGEGRFELVTGNRKGAPAGWYRVLVMADNFEMVDPPPSPVWPNYPEGFFDGRIVSDRYLYFNKTDVFVEVREGASAQDYVLRLNP